MSMLSWRTAVTTPNLAVVAPREARNLGIERKLMKLVGVTQWVRTTCASPTGPKPSQQVWSDVHVHTQQWAYGAGRNEDAGRVIEPRKVYSRGQQDISQRSIEGKADGFH